MIVFNHSLYFKDEPQLQENIPSGEYTTVVISESENFSLEECFPERSSVFPISGRDACYRSRKSFGKMKKPYSWALEIIDVMTLIWDHKENRIYYKKGKLYTPELLQFWILHTVFPLVLELEGVYRILHVGSVEIEEKPVLFSAFAFGGKSTLTDYFLHRGHTLLSDDALGVEKRGNVYYAIPSYPFHRPFREVETLGYPVSRFASIPKPLHAIYRLHQVEFDASVKIIELHGIEKFKEMHYAPYAAFSFSREEYFAYFTEMASHIPVYRVDVPWNLKKLGDVYDAIMLHTNGSLPSQ